MSKNLEEETWIFPKELPARDGASVMIAALIIKERQNRVQKKTCWMGMHKDRYSIRCKKSHFLKTST
jgi:hypothetical protein